MSLSNVSNTILNGVLFPEVHAGVFTLSGDITISGTGSFNDISFDTLFPISSDCSNYLTLSGQSIFCVTPGVYELIGNARFDPSGATTTADIIQLNLYRTGSSTGNVAKAIKCVYEGASAANEQRTVYTKCIIRLEEGDELRSYFSPGFYSSLGRIKGIPSSPANVVSPYFGSYVQFRYVSS